MLTSDTAFVLFDTEFTAWEGSQERRWSGPNECREIVQIGAIKVDTETLTEIDSYARFIKPMLNPTISDYLMELTGISQESVTAGKDFPEAIREFKDWCGSLTAFSFGRDGEVIDENCHIHIAMENPFSEGQLRNLRHYFEQKGISTQGYNSSTFTRAFGKEPERRGHDALNDARTILDALVLFRKYKVAEPRVLP